MQAPQYRDFQQEALKNTHFGDANIRLISGAVRLGGNEIQGPVIARTTRPLLADVTLPTGGELTIELDEVLTIQFYVYRGAVNVAGRDVMSGQLAYLGQGDKLTLTAKGDSGLLLFGGQALNEPISHYGPFVMNTQAEIDQALNDYRNSTLAQPVIDG